MYCPKCGTENPEGAQLCLSCGQNLTSPATVVAIVPGKTSGSATASLILAILSPFTCGITALPAIILGIVAFVKISKSAGQLKGTGLAVAGIAVPFVTLPFVAAILLPPLARVRQIAFRQVCGTNMKGLGKAMLIYACYYDDKYPTPSKWCDLLVEYAEVTPKSFICKGAPKGPSNYAINENAAKLGLKAPPGMVLLFESTPGWNQSGGPELLTTENHQGDGCNILYMDGYVEFVKTQQLPELLWKLPDQ